MPGSVSPVPDSAEEPKRLSSIYRFHNAPEVIAYYGPEYEERPSTASEKVSMSIERAIERGRIAVTHIDGNENLPPRIIFGMKVRTFLVVTTIVILIIVGAVVGGIVGGKKLRDGDSSMYSGHVGTRTSSVPSAPSVTASASGATATPTYSPLATCAASNGTTYTSQYSHRSSNIDFTTYCDFGSPLELPSGVHIAEAFVYSFSDCIEVCAGYDFWNHGDSCTVAVYRPTNSRPGNCWIGNAGNVSISALPVDYGQDVALLQL